jgi:endonuclease/exonuclease/phosphatase family metal-dependent hydrolase
MKRPRSPAILQALALASFLAFRPAAAEPFTVLSYNVENWLTMDRTTADKRGPASKPESEKAAAVAVITAHRPALVGILEIGDRADLDDLRARLRANGLDYPHVEWHQGLDSTRHVALLSQFPIVAHDSQDRVTFDVNGQPNGIQRGILDVTVEPEPGYRVRLVGLHLKSRRKVPDLDETTLRAKEAWFVREALDAIFAKTPDARLLLFGDLNDTRDTYPVRELLGPRGTPGHLTAIPLADSRGERWTHSFQAADEYARIDFFLASRALLPEIDREKSGIDDSPQWRDASDHRAIFVTIRPPQK